MVIYFGVWMNNKKAIDPTLSIQSECEVCFFIKWILAPKNWANH